MHHFDQKPMISERVYRNCNMQLERSLERSNYARVNVNAEPFQWLKSPSSTSGTTTHNI